MLKKIGFIFLLIVSVFGVVLGGKYVYDKQAYQLSFSNFKVSIEATSIYIPNATLFYAFDVDTKQFNFPSEISTSKTKILNFLKKNGVTDELYVSYDDNDYAIALRQSEFNSEQFIQLIEKELNCDVNENNNTINVGATTYNYFTDKDFFVFSTSKIHIHSVKQFDKPKGNYHYLIQKSKAPKQQFFKHHNSNVYSFTMQKEDTVKGKPVSPHLYYNSIPSNFDTLRFYGSTRFQNDIKNLTGSTKNEVFFSWVDNSVLHLKKDSLEILIGIQNEFQNLGDLLDEQTVSLSNDSLLPPSIFKNNYEIHVFESNFNWKSIVPYNESNFKFYSEFNNYNVIGNSIQAMNWFITELQLGNTFSTRAKNFHHPKNVHQLTLMQSEVEHHLISKNWTTRTETFVSEVSSANTTQLNSSGLTLVSSFPIELTGFKIKTVSTNDTLAILVFTDETIMSFTTDGEVNWTNKLESPLVSFPLEVNTDSLDYLVLLMKNSIDVIDNSNTSLKGFPIQLNDMVIRGNLIQNASNFRILVETEHKIININEAGQLTEGFTEISVSSKLKTPIEVGVLNNQTVINYVDIDDSVFVKNKFGNSILTSALKLNLDHASNFLSGDQNNLRIHGFTNPYITSQLLNSGQKDSLKINQKLEPTDVKWTRHKHKTYLVIEEFNRVLVVNEFGLLEKEIQKPSPNLKLISNAFFGDDIVIFSDFKNKKLYLLDSFGRNVSEYPVSGESIFDTNYKRMVVYFNSKIYIYSLETY